jgi:putative endonuclease
MGTAFDRGMKAEAQARAFLEAKGYVALAVRCRTPYGEIDLVMQDQDTIVAVEVKYRKSIEDSLYCLSDRQKQRISDALLYYTRDLPQDSVMLRVDVVLLSACGQILHFENAW